MGRRTDTPPSRVGGVPFRPSRFPVAPFRNIIVGTFVPRIFLELPAPRNMPKHVEEEILFRRRFERNQNIDIPGVFQLKYPNSHRRFPPLCRAARRGSAYLVV